jgi:hypothetical protein
MKSKQNAEKQQKCNPMVWVTDNDHKESKTGRRKKTKQGQGLTTVSRYKGHDKM